jgi:hypothetical protein
VSEENKHEKKKEEKNEKDEDDKDKYKMVPIIIRVQKWLLEAYDKTCTSGRPEPIRTFMRERVATYGGKIPVNFEELKADADKHKAEMENLRKNNPKIERLLFRVHKKDVEGEHIPLVIEELTNNFKILEAKQWEEKFDDYDVLQTVFYLKEKQAFEDAKRRLKKYLTAGNGIVEQKEPEQKQCYIPIAEICDDSTCGIYHTKLEHQEQQRKEQEKWEAEEREEQLEREKWEAEHSDEDEDDEDFEEEEW